MDPIATESLPPRRGKTRVVLLATETPGHLFLFVLFLILRIFLLSVAQSVIVIVPSSALALAGVWEVVLRGRVGIVDGLGPVGRGSLRRRNLVIRASTSLASQ
jgi:hypothetical protein